MADADQQYVTQSQFGMFVEHMNDQFDRVLDAVEFSTSRIPAIAERVEEVAERVDEVSERVNEVAERVEKLEDDMAEVKSDVKDIKITVIKTSKQLQDHERRIAKLESART